MMAPLEDCRPTILSILRVMLSSRLLLLCIALCLIPSCLSAGMSSSSSNRVFTMPQCPQCGRSPVSSRPSRRRSRWCRQHVNSPPFLPPPCRGRKGATVTGKVSGSTYLVYSVTKVVSMLMLTVIVLASGCLTVSLPLLWGLN